MTILTAMMKSVDNDTSERIRTIRPSDRVIEIMFRNM